MPESEPIETDLPGELKELLEFPEEDEPALLKHILTSGFDQGCCLRLPEGKQTPRVSTGDCSRLLDALKQRRRSTDVHPEGDIEDPFETDELSQTMPNDKEPVLVLTTQRCDLIKPIASEPLVEVAEARLVEDPEAIMSSRTGSAHLLHLADVEDDLAWVADLRTAGHIPKHWLREQTAAQLLPAGRPRRRLARRLGARKSRDAVPVSVATQFQARVRSWLYQGTERRELCEHFSEFMFERIEESDEWALHALVGEGKNYEEARGAWVKLLPKIRDRVDPFPLSTMESAIYRPQDLSLADYESFFHLDFTNVTYGKKSSDEQAEPHG